ncbi:MAG: hypothetical protein IM600_05710 [Bacteroidetes bacterium]|jgi:hypothetical protein|nr:hypothetical protein [Bacteroidota bacterium]MCA6442908.1 hypothetical protein [Bacteroidota bacterium]
MKKHNNTNETYSYWRNPTKEDIKFGNGSIHIREFKKENCFDKDGQFRLAFVAGDDKRKYHSCNYEWFITRKSKAPTIKIIE